MARRDQPRVAAGRVGADLVRGLQQLDLGPVPRQVVRGRDSDDAAAEHEHPHGRPSSAP